ncbi:alpha mannosidase middle domain-containing protein [Ditylenchus destructor]|uniref:Alpha-mannosidase n=1 Tax=Ditylenchus destructor TaxID=166010 RepID=A0AAD4QTS2_9BILA|nr:alpha mannosidase middle domain-containing protein [Ditylenchus destructor]
MNYSSGIQSGQMEILTGGWVMTDEANAHYFSIVMELMEGHEWVMNHLNVTPEVHWSIDPFGQSSTMAYLIEEAGLKHMLIQRTHYATKRYLAERRQLEFQWRQIWAGSQEKTDIFTHMMPADSYDLGVSCGPDRVVCCEFDFVDIGHKCQTMPPSSVEAIDEKNVAQKAKLLTDQYWKKAQYYTNNVILVPHGSDFRYADKSEWSNQYENLGRLFKHINENSKLYNMHVQFGTLNDFFRLKEMVISENQTKVPILSGDFFVYDDNYDHYWSGYFTTRPFHKYMDRTLQHYLRSADILFTFANQKEKTLQERSDGAKLLPTIYGHLVQARRSLSLFQHHDGITGTSTKRVVEDYAEKLASAINSTKIVIENTAAYILGKKPSSDEQHLFNMDEHHFADKISRKRVVQTNSTLMLFNPLAFERKEISCLLVANERMKILAFSKDGSPSIVPLQQIGPEFKHEGNQFSVGENFELCFQANVPAHSFQKYFLTAVDSNDPSPLHSLKVSYHGRVNLDTLKTVFSQQIVSNTTLNISNGIVTASFNSEDGSLQALKLVNSNAYQNIKMSFMQYGVRSYNESIPGSSTPSGAYLFLPDGPARELPAHDISYVILQGPVRKRVVVMRSGSVPILQTVDLDIGADSLQIHNLVDITNQSDFELIMRMETDDSSKESLTDFYTELNGFQMIHRKRYKLLPMQAHFYPMPGAAILQNERERISVLGRQPLGVASLKPAQVEIVLDRRLTYNDNLGMSEGVMDNRPTESRFRVMFEQINSTVDSKFPESADTAYLSLAANQNALILNHPLMTLISGENGHESNKEIPPFVSLINGSFPPDVHIVAFRTLSQPTLYPPRGDSSNSSLYPAPTKHKPSAALVLHRFGVESSIPTITRKKSYLTHLGYAQIQIDAIFATQPVKAYNATLTLIQVSKEKVNGTLLLGPMELRTWKIDF